MVRRKRRVPKIIRDVSIPLRFGIANVARDATGTATGSLLPAGTVNPLTTISTTMTRFAAPLTSIIGARILVRQVRTLKPKRRRKR